MSGDPLVSIVTPTYNQADFLPATIESVLEQDYGPIEYIVIDDGSTDRTPDVLADYRDDDRVTVLRHENRGQTPTINKGWRRSEGDILAWLNSDDTYLPGAVGTAVAELQAHPDVGVVHGDSVYIDGAGNRLGTYASGPWSLREALLDQANPIPQPSTFLRREVVEDVGYLDEDLFYPMDWDLWIRSSLRHQFRYVPEELSTFRLHDEAKGVDKSERIARDYRRIYEKIIDHPDLPEDLRDRRDELEAQAHIAAGEAYQQAGSLHRMGEEFNQARDLDPDVLSVRRRILLGLAHLGPWGERLLEAYRDHVSRQVP